MFLILIVKCNNRKFNILRTLQVGTACLISTSLTFYDELVTASVWKSLRFDVAGV